MGILSVILMYSTYPLTASLEDMGNNFVFYLLVP